AAARCTALPTETVTRLAAVSMSKGVVSVSPLTSATASASTPKISAAICTMAVFEPLPISLMPASRCTVPSSFSFTQAPEPRPPPEGAAAHLIGVHAIGLEADVRDIIWPAHNRRGNLRAAWMAGKPRIKVHARLARHEQAITRDPSLQIEHACRTRLAQKKLF